MEPPSQQEKLVAGLAHLAIILPYWGILAPIIIWATQKGKQRPAGHGDPALQLGLRPNLRSRPYVYPLVGRRLDRFNQ